MGAVKQVNATESKPGLYQGAVAGVEPRVMGLVLVFAFRKPRASGPAVVGYGHY